MINTKAILGLDNNVFSLSIIKDDTKKEIYRDTQLVNDLKELSSLFGFKGYQEMVESTKEGLENSVEFNREFDQSHQELMYVQYLYNNFVNELDPAIDKKLNEELKNNYRNDLLASYIENRFERLVYSIFDTLQTLVIEEVEIDEGDIRLYDRLITILLQNSENAEIKVNLKK